MSLARSLLIVFQFLRGQLAQTNTWKLYVAVELSG
jgi:hypothetical protein